MRASRFGFLTAAAVFLPAMLTPAVGRAGDIAFGEYLAGECVTCHRADGFSQGIPAIVGLPERQFLDALAEYRDRRRANPVMQTVAARLSKDEMAALAAYFATLKPAR